MKVHNTHGVVYNPMSHRGMGGGGLLEQVKSSELDSDESGSLFFLVHDKVSMPVVA